MEELISRYFDAFFSLYGIIPLKQAYRIIARQNPEMNMTKQDFADIVSQIDTTNKHYVLWSEDELYYELCDEMIDSYEPSEDTDVFNKLLIGEHVIIDDDAEYYEELMAMQEDRAFYVPDKQELLKHEDDTYYEKTKQYYAMESFIRDELKLNDYYEDIADEMALMATIIELRLEKMKSSLIYLSHHQFKKFADAEQESKFEKLYTDLYNHTRKQELRGHTPYEVGECYNYEYADRRSNNKSNISPSKNGPCPCGSGKKFKRCCMGKGIYD